MWFNKIVDKLLELKLDEYVIEDAKTPSGRVHVGSLRGVIIHDAIARLLRKNDVKVKFIYQFDDTDPMDGLPTEASSELKQYMGKPLYNIPSPDSRFSDIADYYAKEFIQVFNELGINENNTQIIRARDIYKSGLFDEDIKIILDNVEEIRQIYYKVSKTKKSCDWHPLQVICDNCGKIGTTKVTGFDGELVTYECQQNLVSWAQGCTHKGKISPFKGNSKIPWKVEWIVKWHNFKVTFEGAGKDHCTKGGSREVANECYKKIFKQKPPVNLAYEFFLVEGAKMSSSKGVGSTSREIADFLPPEILRFLMLRTQPQRTVNFSTDFEYIIKLFNDYDKLVEKYLNGNITEEEQDMLLLSSVHNTLTDLPKQQPISFQLIVALLQLPHVDLVGRLKELQPNLIIDCKLERKIQAAKYWLDNFALAEDRIVFSEKLSDKYVDLSYAQKGFIKRLSEILANDAQAKTAKDYQSLVFKAARDLSIPQFSAFKSFYLVLISKDSGPQSGSLIHFLGKDFIVNSFSKAEFNKQQIFKETVISQNEFKKQQEKITKKYNIKAIQKINEEFGIVEYEIKTKENKNFIFRLKA